MYIAYMKQRPLIFIVLGIVLLVGLFVMFKPSQDKKTIQQKDVSESPTVQPISNNKTFNLVIKDKKIASGSGTILVNQDDEVTINVVADEADELHLHGYDKSVELEPNIQKSLQFKANVSG